MNNNLFSKIEIAENFLNSINKTLYVQYEVGSFVFEVY